ncbi:MAG: DUF998 domain-containing protein [Bacteroidia bacterium]|nr:DUF998 domain-containing protein [Bacteroidia bacterium]
MLANEFHFNTKTKILLSCGAIGSLLFVFSFIIEGAVRTDYDTFRYPVSSLSIGNCGWTQVANFITSGLLFIAFAVGLKLSLNNYKGKGVLLVGLVGAGLVGAGLFTTDPVYGYPENQPLLLAQYTLRGHLHDLFSILVFICLPWACLVFRKYFITRSQFGLAKYCTFTAISVLVTFFLAGIGFKQTPYLVNIAGILQRSSIIIGCLWIVIFAVYLLKSNSQKVDRSIN